MNRACFPKEKHQNSQTWAKFINFSFWPFLWFGLPGRRLKKGVPEPVPDSFPESSRTSLSLIWFAGATPISDNPSPCAQKIASAWRCVQFLVHSGMATLIKSRKSEKSGTFSSPHMFCPPPYCQRKIKGQQLKGKIVSEFFTLLHTFSEFSPRTFPFKTKGFSSRRKKRRKDNKRTGQIDVAR